jgi:DNA-binding MarR family transcriptional regulator
MDAIEPADGPYLITLIRRVHLAVRRQVVADLHAAGFTDLTPAHVYLFQSPGPDGMRPGELAVRTNTTKQAMNHLLAFLEAQGYVRRVAAPGDGRARVVRLTPRGRAVVEAMGDSVERIEQDWVAQLGVRPLRALWRTLRDVDALVGD